MVTDSIQATSPAEACPLASEKQQNRGKAQPIIQNKAYYPFIKSINPMSRKEAQHFAFFLPYASKVIFYLAFVVLITEEESVNFLNPAIMEK